jgi:hypothetical protein
VDGGCRAVDDGERRETAERGCLDRGDVPTDVPTTSLRPLTSPISADDDSDDDDNDVPLLLI